MRRPVSTVTIREKTWIPTWRIVPSASNAPSSREPFT